MADIIYCDNAQCPFKDCERHLTRIVDACIKGKVVLADLDGVCKRYIAYLVEEANNGERIHRARSGITQGL